MSLATYGQFVKHHVLRHACLPIEDYDLAATLTSGQSFRWYPHDSGWAGVVAGRWVRLEAKDHRLFAQVAEPVSDWIWLEHYLGSAEPLAEILATFPQDAPMKAATEACRGLRLLRQDPWECLASFILSSTKQIVQIQQCVSLLCQRFGEPVPVPVGQQPAHSFPSWGRLSEANESELRECKLGFRAPYLSGAARAVSSGKLALNRLSELSTADARDRLMELSGVGPKVANCVLLFAYGRQDAFPVDVWVLRALRGLYFPKRRPKLQTLERFTQTYFGPHAGYAQQYLFHYVRTKRGVRNGRWRGRSKSHSRA